MPSRDTAETRAVTLMDIPLVRRLNENGIVLDSELGCTQDSAQNPRLFTLFLPSRGIHTMVARADKQQIVGQFRLRQDPSYAHIAYIAPALENGEDDTLWLHMLDAMAAEAGKRGAHVLVAEVDENDTLFTTMRTASYAIYARQEIWRLYPENRQAHPPNVELTETAESDLNGIYNLFGNVVPKLVQPITELPEVGNGWVYRKDERVEGFIGCVEGKAGVYLTPHLHPDVFSDAPAIMAAALELADRSHKVPLYVRVRRYQDWLDGALTRLGFELCVRQAVMVKHIAAGVRAASFAPLSQKLDAVPSTAKPPTAGIEIKSCEDTWASGIKADEICASPN